MQCIFENPSVNESVQLIQEAISKLMVIIILGKCRVYYKGRASSKLTLGERIVIIKQDKSILIHRPKGYEPVNWQPYGSIIRVLCSEEFGELNDEPNGGIQSQRKIEVLSIKAIRRRPLEVLTILFQKINTLGIFNLVDNGEFSLYASEEDMQKAIILYPEIVEPGFTVTDYEKKVDPGFVDVYGIDAQGRLVVIEVKRKIASKKAILQLERYLNSIRRSINKEMRGIIIAPNIARDVQVLLVTLGLEFKRLSPKKCAQILWKKSEKKILDSYM